MIMKIKNIVNKIMHINNKQCPLCTVVGSIELKSLDNSTIAKCNACQGKLVLPKSTYDKFAVIRLFSVSIPEKGRNATDYKYN